MREERGRKILLTEGRLLDYTIVFLIARKFVKRIKKWPAYEMGIIDEQGKKIRDPETAKEKDNYTLLDRLILKMKHLVGHHKLRVLTAFLLLKEENELENLPDDELVEHFRRKRIAREVYSDMLETLEDEGITEDEFWNILLQEEAGE